MHSLLFLMLTIGQASYAMNACQVPEVFRWFRDNRRPLSTWIPPTGQAWCGQWAIFRPMWNASRIGSPTITSNNKSLTRNMVIIGTVGKSPVHRPAGARKEDRRERHCGKMGVILSPDRRRSASRVSSALVIAGSDKRGTIYGIYDLSEQIGVLSLVLVE